MNKLTHYKNYTRLVCTAGSLWFALLCMSCDELIDAGSPHGELDRPTVFADDATADLALEGIYRDMAGSYHFIQGLHIQGISFINGMAADEYLDDPDGDEGTAIYKNEIDPRNLRTSAIWEYAYKSIYFSNAAIEGLAGSVGVSPTVKPQLDGEAKFIRALNYFYLVNQFGDVPVVTGTDYRENMKVSRTPTAQVYQLIVQDLEEAQRQLTPDYARWGGQRVRANKWAATALLARVYLYREEWAGAEAEAAAVISQSALYSLVSDLNEVFLKNSSEAIWQLLPPTTTYNTSEGFVLNYYNAIAGRFMVCTEEAIYAFEENDLRQSEWLNEFTVGNNTFYHPHKYKVGVASEVKEYYLVLRLAEQYLIRAEARAQQGDISGAQADLNAIRNRSGLPDTEAESVPALLEAVEQERRIELMAESGHRWLDLKRWNKTDEVLGAVKPNWQHTDALFPIPQIELERNTNLTQNPGYSE